MASIKHSFLDLPYEIRHLIYHHVFVGSQIVVDQEQGQHSHTPLIHTYRNYAFRTEVLRVCKKIQAEAFPILASHTSLLLQSNVRKPNDAVKFIPPIWISHIRVVLNNARIRSRITHVLRIQHIDPLPFHNLRVYRVAHLVYPDWRDSCHKPEDVDPCVETQLESEFFFQASTLRLFTKDRPYALTATVWLLRAFVEESIGWEVDFSLDTWTVVSKRKAKFRRHKSAISTLCEDPKCRDHRYYDVEYL